jgi:hypothetical protein
VPTVLPDPVRALVAALSELKVSPVEQGGVHPASADGAETGEPLAQLLPLPELWACAPPQPVIVPAGLVVLAVVAPLVAAALAVKRFLLAARGFAEEVR